MSSPGGALIDIVLVAAVADNGVIGRDGGLPWRLRSDMALFRALTMGKPVVMGRKTFLSLPKPLAGRTNIVVSRDPAFAAPGVVAAPSLAGALDTALGDAMRRDADAIAVIGGAEIYAAAMPLATRLIITHVHLHPEGDTVFPPIDDALWREVARRDHDAAQGDDAAFSVVTYARAHPRL